MIEGYTALKNVRFERKFVVGLNEHNAELLVKYNPGNFSEIFNSRNVNNIYFDTPQLSFYNENVIGAGNRKKIRIRWYGDLKGHISQPILEYKIKHGLAGEKKSFKIDAFDFNDSTTAQNVIDCILNSDVPQWVKFEIELLVPKLVNQYSRKYFLSSDRKFRITIDKNICYYSFGNLYQHFNSLFQDSENIILELKYDSNLDKQAHYITNTLPFRMGKNSKYVNGIEKINLFSS